MRARRSQRVMAALAIASVALGACSVLTGLDADYSATAHDGAAAIGSEGGSDAPGTDGGGLEGSTTDGMVAMEAGDGSTLTFCELARGDSGPDDFFCADFEHDDVFSPTTGPKGFESVVNNIDGGFAILPNAGFDRTHALDVVSTTANSAIYRQVLVSKALTYVVAPDQYKSFELAFDFRVVSSVVDYDAYALLVFGPTNPKENGIAGYAAAPAHQISHEGPEGPVHFDNDTSWHTAKITLEHATAGTPFTRTITVNGETALETNTPGHVFDSASHPILSIGSFNTLNSAGLSHVQFDNVVVRRRHFP
jgi:hypothetical protein